MRTKRTALFAGAALGLALYSGPSFAAQQDSDWRPDAWITTKAKIALLTAKDVNAMDANVDTINGRVTIHGKVPDQAAKKAAVAAVKQVEGVKDVTDLLQVVPPAKAEQVSAKDDAVEDNVEKAIEARKLDDDIDVESVNNGIVLLSGQASLDDQLAALRTASAVPGVKGVASEMTTPTGESAGDSIASGAKKGANTVAEGAKDGANAVADGAKSAASATRDATVGAAEGVSNAASDAGEAMSDAWITTKVKTALLADDEAPALDVNVDTNDGVVTLFGTVNSAQAKSATVNEAKQVDGVKSVRDLIQVVAKSNEEQVERKDEEISSSIERELDGQKQFTDADIDVQVEKGVVRLTGTAPTTGIRLSAATIARAVSGVRSVQNDIKIEGEEKHASLSR